MTKLTKANTVHTAHVGAPTEQHTPNASEAPTARPQRALRANTKQAALIAMLRAPEGATLTEIVAATNWLPHTARGALAGAIKKRLGLTLLSEVDDERGRVYRIPS